MKKYRKDFKRFSIEIIKQLGEAQFQAKNYSESVKYYQEAKDKRIELSKKSNSSLNVPAERTDLGYALLRAGNTTDAEKELLTAFQEYKVQIEEKATLVEYSIIGENDLLIWVIQPNGQIHFRQVDLASPPSKPLSPSFNFASIWRIGILVIGE